MVLEEKLEKARRQSADRAKKIAIGVSVTIVLCGLVIAARYFFDFSVTPTTKVNPPQQAAPPVIPAEVLRGEVKELLTQYENELAPRLRDAGVKLWNPDALLELSELKKTAISSFSVGAYGDAIASLRQLKTKATTLLEESDQLFQESFDKASAFLAEDLYEEARRHVNTALMIAPQSPETLELQQQIEKLSSLLPLLDEVKVARSENDLHKEYELLQRVVLISPERRAAVERLEVVQRQLQEQKYAEQISLAYGALERRQPGDARRHYLEARSVNPGREELELLGEQLLALEISLRVEMAILQAGQAVRRDDWQRAQKHFTAILQEAPHNSTAVAGKKRADLIVRLQERFTHFMKDPYRLADVKVRGQATKTLLEAEPALSYSFTINKQAQELRNLIEKVSRKVPVIIESDNSTYILVRGVGKVGFAAKQQIELKPGNYIFEGRREGYKSKLVHVLIPYDQEDFRLSVICDEPI